MPQNAVAFHRGARRSPPSSFCTWEGVHPNVLGSLVIRLSRDGYGVLFGTTSDGGRLTLTIYLGDLKYPLYFKQDVSPDEIFRAVAKVLDISLTVPTGTAAVRKRGKKGTPPPAAIRTETAPERADRLFEERQDAIQKATLKWLEGGKKT